MEYAKLGECTVVSYAFRFILDPSVAQYRSISYPFSTVKNNQYHRKHPTYCLLSPAMQALVSKCCNHKYRYIHRARR